MKTKTQLIKITGIIILVQLSTLLIYSILMGFGITKELVEIGIAIGTFIASFIIIFTKGKFVGAAGAAFAGVTAAFAIAREVTFIGIFATTFAGIFTILFDRLGAGGEKINFKKTISFMITLLMLSTIGLYFIFDTKYIIGIGVIGMSYTIIILLVGYDYLQQKEGKPSWFAKNEKITAEE